MIILNDLEHCAKKKVEPWIQQKKLELLYHNLFGRFMVAMSDIE
jgi:hypothetical protein